MGCHFILLGTFLTQGSNPRVLCPLHWQVDALPLSHQAVTRVSGPLARTPQIQSLSHHRALNFFQAPDSLHLQSWTFLWWVLREDHCCTGDCDLPDHHSTKPTRWTSPDLNVMAIMCLCLHLPQLFSMCVAISLVAGRATEQGAAGNWSTSIWCFCFAMTLTVFIVEFYGFHSHFPFFWFNFP